MKKYEWKIKFRARGELKNEARKKLAEDLLVALYKVAWDNMELGLRGFPKLKSV